MQSDCVQELKNWTEIVSKRADPFEGRKKEKDQRVGSSSASCLQMSVGKRLLALDEKREGVSLGKRANNLLRS